MVEDRLSICAVIAVRNELRYLRRLLPLLAAQAVEVAMIDNESTDGSRELYADFMGKPIISIETLPYRGSFSLSEQLAAKQAISERIHHDWIIHLDADEILEHRQAGLTLRDAIHEADEAGYNALNFDEFVFLPEPHSDYSNQDYYANLLRYYFFEPAKNRCNRAWKRSAQLNNTVSGGHRLQGGSLALAPTHHILRHYIVLSAAHAREKYLNRTFDSLDVSRGWHGNRRNFTEANLALPDNSHFLFRLASNDSKEFCRARPTKRHFWQWEAAEPCANTEKRPRREWNARRWMGAAWRAMRGGGWS